MPDRRFPFVFFVLALALLTGCDAVSHAIDTAKSSASAAKTSGAQTATVTPPAGASKATPQVTSKPSVAPSRSGAATSSTAPGTGAGLGSGPLYDVVGISDGDTIRVNINGVRETVRLIGLDTPETKKPHTPVQCYGKEASSNMQSLVQSKQVQLVADPSQGERDRYGRLLRHVYVGGATNVALAQIDGGFGKEYRYGRSYAHRLEYLAAMNRARTAKRGTWGPPCNGFHAAPAAAPTSVSTATPSVHRVPQSPDATPKGACAIKGNITADGEKIAHEPGDAAYERTRITPAKGERWFCSADEAMAAGWRMARD